MHEKLYGYKSACCIWLRLTAVSWEVVPGIVVPVTDPDLGRYKDGIRAVGLG